MFKIVLKKKIIALFLFFGLLPLVITFILTVFQIQKSLRETVSSNLTSLASEVASSIEKTVRGVYTDVELLSVNPLIRSKDASNEEKLSEITRIQDFYGIFEDITLIDLDGNVIISTTYKYRGEWKNKQWYQDAREGKSSISPAYIILGPYKVILSSAAPVRDEQGKIIAVIAGQVNMETIRDIVSRIKIGEKGFVFIVDKEGRFAVHPEKEDMLAAVPYSGFAGEVLSRDSGIINYTGQNKEEMIGGFASFLDTNLKEQLGWRLVVAQPKEEAFALVAIFQKQVIVIFLGGLVLLLGIGYLLGDRIVVPMKELIAATRKIALGELESKIDIKTGDEIEELARSFNKMADDLKESRADLEKSKNILEVKVAARTKELQELTKGLEYKVKERTKELQSRLDELERFHRLTIGRELKMIELKKELKNKEKPSESAGNRT
ncbi:MAG: cache domain-containing protein [Candidatus Pacebacteria bacterium]|nr:cache domain-containing protein [Candidatus Paceibacterota bacterium]